MILFDYHNFPFRFEVHGETGFLLEYLDKSYVNDEHNISWPTTISSLIKVPMSFNTTHIKVNLIGFDELGPDDTAYRL
jgi:hypothetical protein